jgi:hypothetical protein
MASDEKPFDPYRALAINGLIGLALCGLWTVGIVLAHASPGRTLVGAIATALVGGPLALGWLVVMLAWASERAVLRAQGLCFVVLGVGAIGLIGFALATKASFHYTPGIATAAIAWGLRLWGRASAWPEVRIRRVTRAAIYGAGAIEVTMFVLAIVLITRLVSRL